RQRSAQLGAARRPLVRELHSRRGGIAPRRAAGRGPGAAELPGDAGPMIPMNYQDLLLSLANDDSAVVVLTAENRAHLGALPQMLGPRFIDVGICEQTLVGASAGLALRGRVPIAHALASFLTMRAFEFIRTDVGIPGLPVILVGFVPGFLSTANGPTHQA